MADATQVQRRRGTAAQCAAMTPAEGEIIVNMTDDRLHVGDGIVAGGIILPNARDLVRQSFTYGVAGGTGDAITLSVSQLLAYAEGAMVEFRATAANTGTVTIDINGLGTRSIYKNNGLGIVPLVGGDIVSGGIYRILYDGAQFQLTNFAQKPVSDSGLVKIGTLTGDNVNIITFNDLGTFNGFFLRFRTSRVSQGVQTVTRLFIDNNILSDELGAYNASASGARSGYLNIERGYVDSTRVSSTVCNGFLLNASILGASTYREFNEISLRASSGTWTKIEATLYGYAE